MLWRSILVLTPCLWSFLWSCGWLLVSGCHATPPASDDPVEDPGERVDGAAHAARALRDVLGAIPPETELRELTRLGGGLLRARFALRAGGLPIDGGAAIVVLRPDGSVRTVVTGIRNAASLPDAAPRIDAAAAESAAIAGRPPGTSVEASPTLVALPRAGSFVAAWRVIVRGAELRRELFIDAVTAQVIHEREGLYAASEHGSGIGVLGERRPLEIYRGSAGYELRDDTRGEHGIRTSSAGGTQAVPGRVVRSRDRESWDTDVVGAGAAVDAHANGAIVWDYLERILGRSSWDGDGGALRLVVHSGARVANAYWDGRYAVFGDGDDSMLAPPAALDVVAHEIFHGVTGSEAGLVYEGQPGALSESLSDVFGSLVENDVGPGNWSIGETIADPPLRDLAEPQRTGAPSHMREYLELPLTPDGDMGGVHLNSTIPSHAAVLLADGGAHGTSHVRVTAIGRQAMGQVWWRATSVYLTPRASFSDFAQATVLSAEDLFGSDSPQTASVHQAWRAVGVIR